MGSLQYSFDDEVASKFCYDMENKELGIHFTGCFDLLKSQKSEGACSVVIKKWVNAYSKLYNDSKYDNLEKHLGIFSMILSLEVKGKDIELIVNTLDNQYICLRFVDAQIDFNQHEKID